MGARGLRTLPVAASALGTLLLLAAPPASAVPRFAARQGLPCATCHVDPSGGGMRTAYGSSVFAANELAFAAIELPEGAAFLDGQLTEAISVGSDVRLMHYFREQPGNRFLHRNSFYLMEATLYLAADLWDRVTLYVAPALHGSETLTFEASGIVRLPWVGLYAKVGRFVPVYGHKLPNHTHFIRQQMGFGVLDKAVGVELGLTPGHFNLQTSVFAGARAGLDWDDNDLVGVSARLAYIPTSRWFKGKVGVSLYYNLGGAPASDPVPDTRVEDLKIGTFMSMSVGRFTALGEIDFWRRDDRTQPNPNGQFFWHNELSFRPHQGVELVATHELWDPDVELYGDAVNRVGFGLDLFPWPYTELTIRYRYTIAAAGHDWADIHDLMTVFHFFL